MTDGKNRLKHVERLTEISKLRKVAACWLHSEKEIVTLMWPNFYEDWFDGFQNISDIDSKYWPCTGSIVIMWVLQLRKECRRTCAPGCENIMLLWLNYKKARGRNWEFEVFLPLTEPLLFLSPHFPVIKTEATETDVFSQVDLHEMCQPSDFQFIEKVCWLKLISVLVFFTILYE